MVKVELFTTFHFVIEGIAGFLEFFGFGVPEVDEIAVVGEDMVEADVVFVTGVMKGFDFAFF